MTNTDKKNPQFKFRVRKIENGHLVVYGPDDKNLFCAGRTDVFEQFKVLFDEHFEIKAKNV